MKITNLNMSIHLNSLNSISNKVTGKLGYAVARNIRKLSNELVEFENIRQEHIRKYGKENENGEYIIKKGTKEFDKFVADMSEFANIAHDVDIFMVEDEDLIKSSLTADEMILLEFMTNVKNTRDFSHGMS